MGAQKLVLSCGLPPGDIVMLTAAVRDLHRAAPGRFLTDVRTPWPALWEHNPFLTRLDGNAADVEEIACHYPLIHRSNHGPHHFVHGFPQFLSEKLGVAVAPTGFGGDIRVSGAEIGMASQVAEILGGEVPFWIVAAGGKRDFTIKWWETRRFQEVVDHFEGKLLFVQVGAEGHHHPPLRGTLDLRGKTGLRQLVRLVYHSSGVLCPVTLTMHLAAAVPFPPGGLRPCVVVAGGREPPQWETYPGHRFLHTVGALPCCSGGGCWKSRTVPLGDGDPNDRSLCVDVAGDLPRCMDMISSSDAIRAIEGYHVGGMFEYLSSEKADLAIAHTRT